MVVLANIPTPAPVVGVAAAPVDPVDPVDRVVEVEAAFVVPAVMVVVEPGEAVEAVPPHKTDAIPKS
jgi:hypothetical protein